MGPERQQVITFHGLGPPPRPVDPGEAACWIPVEWFETILAAMPADGRVAITFDDGNASDLEVALPRLVGAGRTATFFVLTGKLGESTYLTKAGVCGLRRAGMGVGSHGIAHTDWRSVDDERLADEVGGSRRCLSDLLGEPVELAAVPFGSYDRRVLRAARETYRRVFTSDGGPSRCTDWLVARTTVTTERPLDHWVTLVTDDARHSRARQSVRQLVKRFR